MDKKKVLCHLIRAGRDAIHLEKMLNDIGYKETPYFNLYGEIADAVYTMIGEETDTIEESMTHAAMHDIYTSDELCADRLANMIEPHMDIPVATMNIIREASEEKGMDIQQMINLILSDWARKELLFKSVFA